MFIPWPAYLWLIFSSACVTYDTLYIQLRPLTFRHNIYEWKFEPYQVYQFFDTLRVNMEDRFLVIQSWLNAVEVGLILLVVMISLIPKRRVKFYSALAILVLQAMVFWKTVIYLWYDRRFVTVSVERFYTIAVVFYYFTIGQYVIFPLMTIYHISKRIIKAALPQEKAKIE